MSAEHLNPTIYEAAAKDTLRLENLSFSLERIGRNGARIWQVVETLGDCLMLLVEDIDTHIPLLGVGHRVLHLEAVACSGHKACQQQVDVGRAVGTAELNGLLVGGVTHLEVGTGVGILNHLGSATRPAEGYTHEH